MNTQDNMGFAPLHEAVIRGKIDVVENFVSNGANVDAKNEYGETSLHLSVLNKNVGITEFLIANGGKR